MTELTTPTDEVVETPTGSEPSDLPVENTNEPAVETVNDTASPSEDSDLSSNDSTTNNGEDEQSGVDPSLKKFAQAQGFDPENLSPGEVKALKLAQSNQREARKQMQEKNKGAVEDNIKSVDKNSELSDREYLDFRMKQRDMIDNVRGYWNENPDDRQYEAEAAAILQKEKAEYGDEAMFRLAENMPRLIREAKYAAGAFDTTAITEKARKEERARLKKVQEGSADGMNAVTEEKPSKNEVTSEWVRNEYDPNNPEHRKMMDEYTISRGKIY